MAAESDIARLAFWARTMTGLRGAGIPWPGFSYTDAEWARLDALTDCVSGAAAGMFIVVNAVVFIALAAIGMSGVFLPLLLVLFPNPTDIAPLPFALLLGATGLLILGFGLPLSMRATAWLLTTKAVRARLIAAPADAALWAKARFQMTRMTVILCGLLVPGIVVFITFDIAGGPWLTTLKWVAAAVVMLSLAHTWHRPGPRPQ